LLASFGWSELIGQNLRITLWAALASLWIAAVGWSIRQCGRHAAACGLEPEGDSFGKALDRYLRGDYYQTEQILDGLLRRNVRDVEARLMLATLLRHAGRLDEAARHLDLLARFEGAQKWELEMQNERDLLAEAKATKATAA
jgi:thioredoxin-like negative regulator of GroEL